MEALRASFGFLESTPIGENTTCRHLVICQGLDGDRSPGHGQ